MKCLEDTPRGRQLSLPNVPFGKKYSLDMQCKLEFGKQYRLCSMQVN